LLAEKYGSKMSGRSSEAIPGPVSEISMCAAFPRVRLVTVIRSPALQNLIALPMRF
jgi:hypothetical protein